MQCFESNDRIDRKGTCCNQNFDTFVHALPNIVRVIKSRRMRWARHVARIGVRRGVYEVLVGKPEGKSRLVDPGVDGRIIYVLRWIFRKWDVGVWTELSWLRIGRGGR